MKQPKPRALFAETLRVLWKLERHPKVRANKQHHDYVADAIYKLSGVVGYLDINDLLKELADEHPA